MKTCSCCERSLKLELFYRDSSRRDGYREKCKECTKMVECNTCHEKKPSTMFHKNSKRCKSCEKERSRSRRKTKINDLDALNELADCLEAVATYRSHEKKCLVCENTLALEEFNYDRKNKDEHSDICRRCKKIGESGPPAAVLIILDGLTRRETLFEIEMEKLRGDNT